MVIEYLEHCRADLPLLRKALEQRSFAAARKFGHQLKGTGKPYGFPALTEFGLAVETAAAQENLAELAQWVEELEAYVARLEVAESEPQSAPWAVHISRGVSR